MVKRCIKNLLDYQEFIWLKKFMKSLIPNQKSSKVLISEPNTRDSRTMMKLNPGDVPKPKEKFLG